MYCLHGILVINCNKRLNDLNKILCSQAQIVTQIFNLQDRYTLKSCIGTKAHFGIYISPIECKTHLSKYCNYYHFMPKTICKCGRIILYPNLSYLRVNFLCYSLTFPPAPFTLCKFDLT